jgi:hypothetical protein
VAPWVATNRALIERACACGEVRAGAHVDIVARIIASLATYRTSIQRRPVDHAFPVEIIDGFLFPAPGIAVAQPPAA